jgi:hypothetical protein
MQKTIYINSSNRDADGTDDDFTITRVVQEFSTAPKSAKLVSASIPFTWYNVVGSDNQFSITETAVGTDDFIIFPGTYTGAELASTIETMLNESIILTHNYTVSFDSDTLEYTFSNSVNTIQIIFGSSQDAAVILGFDEGSTNPGAPALAVVSTTAAPASTTIPTYNNTFEITETAVGSDSFIIPPGNYDGATLATEIQTLLNNSGVLTHNYTVTFDSNYLLFTISNSVNTIQVIFPANNSAAALLGFEAGSVNPTVAASDVVSTQSAQILPDYEIFICSDLVGGSDNGVMLWSPNYVPAVDNQTLYLARVPITGCYSGVINYSANPNIPFYSVSQSSFARNVVLGLPASMSFSLILPSGLPITLNGYHWTAEIVLQF